MAGSGPWRGGAAQLGRELETAAEVVRVLGDEMGLFIGWVRRWGGGHGGVRPARVAAGFNGGGGRCGVVERWRGLRGGHRAT